MATTISRFRPAHIAIVVICAAAAWAFCLGTPACRADILETVTGAAGEAAGPIVVPAVPEAGAAVTAPVQEVVENVTRTPATVPPPHFVPPAHQAEPALPSAKVPATGGGSSAQGPVAAPVEAVVQAAKEAVSGAATTARPTATVTAAPTVVDPGGADANPAEAEAAASAAAAPVEPGPSSRRNTFVPAPTRSGATGAPQPRSVAYVWPAVALLGPRLADLTRRWGRTALRPAFGASDSSGSSTAAQGVAGVHASGGNAGSSDSSSLFSRIPSSVGHQFQSISTPALVYLGLLMLVVIAVALTVRREILIGRRR